MQNINFGIDLGTTNSAIAKFNNGKVTLFKNPVGFKDTLASVVSYRKGRIQIGDKARERLMHNPESVFSSFKRKMGTEEKYNIPDNGEETTPIELSAKVLAELKNFVTDEEIKSAVITIPASFDTIQSNATKKAGYQSGIDEVVLLQEPIAACLAYSNENNLNISEEKRWLVYDFGGGTFDAALVKIDHRELKIIDHKGNNFLGGLDIDLLVVEKLIAPKIETELGEENIWKKMTSGKDATYTKMYLELLFKAEELKKELSVKPSASLEIDIVSLDLFLDVEISVDELNAVIQAKFEESYVLIEELLQENALRFEDIERIIMVGGTTYIPYIREELKQRTNIEVDTSIDPTTTVVIGAAYYAGNKLSELKPKEDLTETSIETVEKPKEQLDIKWVYETSTQDDEELITGVFEQGFYGHFRIIRSDGGFDSGLSTFNGRISEFVPLLNKSVNRFKISVYDGNKNVVATENIKITSGLYNVSGQPLPNDICIELDDNKNKSLLEPIFKKNQILPLKKTIYKTSSKTILKNSDDKLIINILEGDGGNLAASNLSIGYIELCGKDFEMDLLKGMEVELEFEISESRDLKVGVYISSLDLELNEVFNPSEINVSLPKMVEELKYIFDEVLEEKNHAEYDENFEYLAKLQAIINELKEIQIEAIEIEDDTTTGRKYQLNDRKRKVIQKYDDLTKSKLIISEINAYNEAKSTLDDYMPKANEAQRVAYQKILRDEKDVLESNNKYLIQRKTKQIDKLINEIYSRQDEAFFDWFFYLRMRDEDEFTDPKKFNKLVELGASAMEKDNTKELRAICNQMYQLLKVKPKFGNEDDFIEGNLGLK